MYLPHPGACAFLEFSALVQLWELVTYVNVPYPNIGFPYGFLVSDVLLP
jgi:hypothetical protein